MRSWGAGEGKYNREPLSLHFRWVPAVVVGLVMRSYSASVIFSFLEWARLSYRQDKLYPFWIIKTRMQCAISVLLKYFQLSIS